MKLDRLAARRALEALRAGVPNHDAVSALGSLQTAVDDRFSELLGPQSTPDRSEPAGGMLIGGGFGPARAMRSSSSPPGRSQANFVVSKVVISKETGLHDPVKVLTGCRSTRRRCPGGRVRRSTRSRPISHTSSAEYAALYRWVHADGAPVDSRFAATLFVHEYARGDAEFADRIVRFWAGDPLPLPELRRRLKEAGAAGTYKLAGVKERELAVQRFRFLSRLIRAAGFAGWVILLDEVELIGRYSFLQRAKSYAEVNRWVRGDRDDPGAPLVAVLATVDDFEAQVLVGKNDVELIPKSVASERHRGGRPARRSRRGGNAGHRTSADRRCSHPIVTRSTARTTR